MLPRANCLWRTDVDNLGSLQGTNAIRDDTILCPITTANYITCTYARQGDGMLLAIVLRIEERTSPALDGHLTSSLWRWVWIVASEWICFYISLQLLTVVVTLVGSNHHANLHALSSTNSLHDVDGSHHIGLVCLNRNLVWKANEWLSCKVEDYLWLIFSKDFLHLLTITNICANISLNLWANAWEHKVVTLWKWVETYSYYFGSKFVNPDWEPRALESGVTGYKDFLALIEIVINVYHCLTY